MIRSLIGVEIPLFPEICDQEIEKRIEQEEAANLALTCFVAGKISLSDYLDILEMCEVEMDDFISNAENNLIILGA
jgi:hypothetical protein